MTTLRRFLEDNNHRPLDLEEVAWEAEEVSDHELLADLAERFLTAKAELENLLEEIGFEFG